jgi:CRISPR-associated protein Cas6
MYWQEESHDETTEVTDEVVDLVFALRCRCLPVDHVHALSQAVQDLLPWLESEPYAGLHAVNVAASGNGWVRPEDPEALLHLSRRTKFELRVPKHRIEEAQQLEGATLDVGGHEFTIQQASVRPLSTITTLFTRALATEQDLLDEEAVLDWVSVQLKALNIIPRKMLCGTEHHIETPERRIPTRSLMIADLEVEESLRLQQHGLGPYRLLGCGLFIPHKDINDLRKGNE